MNDPIIVSKSTVRKAHRMPVMPALDGSFRVGGDTDVYHIRRDSSERGVRGFTCNCRAGQTGKFCSHILAVRLHQENR